MSATTHHDHHHVLAFSRNHRQGPHDDHLQAHDDDDVEDMDGHDADNKRGVVVDDHDHKLDPISSRSSAAHDDAEDGTSVAARRGRGAPPPPPLLESSSSAATMAAPAAAAAGQGGALGAGGAQGPGGGAGLKKHGYGLFSPEIARQRALVLKALIGALVMITLIMWGFLPLFWGSLWRSTSYSHNLSIAVVDRDGGSLGRAIVGAAEANANGTSTGGSLVGRLGFINVPESELPSDGSVIEAVVENKYWAALVVNADATSSLARARSTGNASYDPTTAINFYYNQGRNELAANSFIVPITTGLLAATLPRWAAGQAAAYLASISSNATAISVLARAPQTLTPAVAYTSHNLRPYSVPVATAVTLVGMILLLVFSFIFIMAWSGARDALLAPWLTTRALIVAKVAVPMIAYVYLSLVYSMINLPFKVPFGAKYSYAGGYFLWWAFCWLGMCAFGLALEFGVTLLGPKFVAFFLMILIVTQASVVTLPYQLQPALYRYGVAAPFNRLSNAVRTIIFATKNELGEDAGVLIAWIVLSIVTVSSLTWWQRRAEARKARRSDAGGEKVRV